MKHFMLVCALLFTAFTMFAQSSDVYKERRELMKMSKSALNEKASKAAKKEAKKYVKEGWEVAPGALPIEKQLDKAYMMQQQYDESMFPLFIMGEAMSIGEHYDAAKMQAMELAKQSLAGQIQTEITALVDNQVSNKQLSADEAASISQTVSAGKNLISQKIGRVIPVVEMYRSKSNGNKEILVRVGYNARMAKEIAKDAIRDELQQKGEDLSKKLDQLLQ
ncbi:hypothetical protein QR305_04079 [Bacteroides finegoldii]|jgi:hypothetical protein|uniref:Uncharacterized protein n=1 Tax=Bacteroides finegoldii CL09T03C10 TaxID=997888 RepID=K5CLB7_9BACE|nr:hypothetical protein [Bacteroides finegoldii]EKJ90135.1 hypothetical protein HMPREF1057_02775 [Bacteroides finegoldii CL09T03C10]